MHSHAYHLGTQIYVLNIKTKFVWSNIHSLLDPVKK